MIILDSTARSLKISLDAAKTTNDMPVVVSYGERPQTTGIFVSNTKLTNSNGTTATEICAAPTASSLIREVFHISVQNADTASKTVTINLVETATSYPLFKSVMAAADQLIYTTNGGWQLFDSSGNLKQTISSYAGSTSQNFNAANLTVAGNTTLGDATSDTTNIGNGGIVKDASGNTSFGTGTVLVTAANLLGYGTGAGGTVTQATSKSTNVTLNKPCGQITMNGAALAAGAGVTFTVLNSLVTAKDTIILNMNNAAGSFPAYGMKVQAAAGGFLVYIINETGGSLSEAIVLNFAVIKGASA